MAIRSELVKRWRACESAWGLVPATRQADRCVRLSECVDSVDGAAERIAFIRRAQSAGLTLTEIGGVLDVRSDGLNRCSHVSQLLGTKLGEVKVQIGELRKLQQELEALIERSQQLNPADCAEGNICHILGAVASAAPLSSRPAKAISA
jgi:hypothetical protein